MFSCTNGWDGNHFQMNGHFPWSPYPKLFQVAGELHVGFIKQNNIEWGKRTGLTFSFRGDGRIEMVQEKLSWNCLNSLVRGFNPIFQSQSIIWKFNKNFGTHLHVGFRYTITVLFLGWNDYNVNENQRKPSNIPVHQRWLVFHVLHYPHLPSFQQSLWCLIHLLAWWS